MPATVKEAALIDQLSRLHQRLAERVRSLDAASPDVVLDIGTAVLFHGIAEFTLLPRLNPLIDDDVQWAFFAEHQRLADDLALLESLWTAEPDSSDAHLLAGVLLDRLRNHALRDDRVFYRAGAGRAS